jgi:hypothetical protein
MAGKATAVPDFLAEFDRIRCLADRQLSNSQPDEV